MKERAKSAQAYNRIKKNAEILSTGINLTQINKNPDLRQVFMSPGSTMDGDGTFGLTSPGMQQASQISKGTDNFLQGNEEFAKKLKQLKEQNEKDVSQNLQDCEFKIKKAFERQTDLMKQKSMDARGVIGNITSVKSQKNIIDYNS